MHNCILIGVPVHDGASQRGCAMGPEALRTAALQETLESLGHKVEDRGDIAPNPWTPPEHPNAALKNLSAIGGWIDALTPAAEAAAQAGTPIFLGGDHSLAAGSVAGVARVAAAQERPLFLLWLDAHTDYNTLESTCSGNLHGTPVAYFTGLDGFEPFFPKLDHAVAPANICMMGLRSVDPAEVTAISHTDMDLCDMRAIDEEGVSRPLKRFLQRVEAADGWLHVSLDVDFLDPGVAPAVGTTVPGGATFREAHLIMELVHESGLLRSLDLVELNPFLDDRGKTARLLVDLTASLFGRRILDRKTMSF